MTRDYRIILPVMFAVVISLLISQRLDSNSVYLKGLARKGIRLERGRDVEVLEGLRVEEVMQTKPATLRESDALTAASDVFLRARHHGLPVVDGAGELVGVLTVQDLDRAHADGGNTTRTVGDVCTRDLLVAYPDETLGAALRRMSVRDVGRLPVVARADPCRLLGVLRRTDLVRAYDAALTRRAALRHQAAQVRLGVLGDVSVEEAIVEPGAPCADKRVSEVAWPRECGIATLRRGRQVLIPHGDTVLQAHDVLIVVAESEAREAVQRLCMPGKQA